MSLIGFSMEQNNLKGLMWVQTITDTLSCIIAIVLYYIMKKEITKNLILIKISIKLLYMVCTILKFIKVMILKK